MRDKTKTVDLSDVRDLDIKAITMRETASEDTLDAAERATPPDGKVDPAIFNYQMRIQTLAGAITSYTDLAGVVTQCAGPCLAIERWSTRTREFVGDIYDYMNGVSTEERDRFLAKLKGASTSASPAAGAPSADRAKAAT